jgi:hypothetical protein
MLTHNNSRDLITIGSSLSDTLMAEGHVNGFGVLFRVADTQSSDPNEDLIVQERGSGSLRSDDRAIQRASIDSE